MHATAPRSRTWLQSPWLRPFNDTSALDDLVQRLLPRAALVDIRAKVVQVIEESTDTRSFILHCNRHWRGFRAGQHVLVTMEMRGRRVQRCFSLSSAPDNSRRIRITVKRQSTSGVTAWMHESLRVGTLITLSRPLGEFCLPEVLPDKLLMLSAGSGITPLASMLHALRARSYQGDVVLLHACRDQADWILHSELRALAQHLPGLRLLAHFSQVDGRMDAPRLAHLVPDFSDRLTLLCGPPRFRNWVGDLYRQRHAQARLRQEAFGVSGISVDSAAGGENAVHCLKSERSFTTAPGQSLLLAAEAAGMTPRYGCRIGICRTCQCRLRGGSVENLLTGEITQEPGQWVQLCVSAARSPLTLDL